MSTKKRWTTEEVTLLKSVSNKGKEYIVPLFPDRTWKSIRHKIVNSGFEIVNTYERYTKQEDDLLRLNSQKSEEYLLALLPNRKWDSIRYRIEILKLPRDKAWTYWTESEELILKNFDTMEEIQSLLPHRTKDMIQNKANKMGVIFGNPWSKEDENILREMYPMVEAEEVAVMLNRSLQAVYVKAHKLRITSYLMKCKVDKEEAIRLYVEEKMLLKEIGDIFSVPSYTISKIIPKELRRDINHINPDIIINKYVVEGLGMPTISKQLKISVAMINTVLRENEIEIKKSNFYRLDLPLSEIKDMYLYGFSSVEIAEVYFTNSATIVERLREKNIPIRKGSGFYIVRRTDHRNLINGIEVSNSTLRGRKEYFQWRTDVYKRDNYTCQCCGDNAGGVLNAHHINNFSAHKSLRYDIKNGISLCILCHIPNQYGSFHHTYGTHNNDIYQLQEYFDDIRTELCLPHVYIEDIVNN